MDNKQPESTFMRMLPMISWSLIYLISAISLSFMERFDLIIIAQMIYFHKVFELHKK